MHVIDNVYFIVDLLSEQAVEKSLSKSSDQLSISKSSEKNFLSVNVCECFSLSQVGKVYKLMTLLGKMTVYICHYHAIKLMLISQLLIVL